MAEGRTGRPSHRAAVHRLIQARGEIELSVIADELDISVKTVQRQCAALAERGLVELRGEGAQARALDAEQQGANKPRPPYYALLGVSEERCYPDVLLDALFDRALIEASLGFDAGDMIEAFYVLLYWAEEYLDEGHDAWVKGHTAKAPIPADRPLLLRLVQAACDAAEEVKGSLREGDQRFAVAYRLGEALGRLPGHLRSADLVSIRDLDVRAILDGLLALDEFRHLESRRIELAWKSVHAATCGKAILGRAAKVSQREIDLWPEAAGPAPWWRITLALDLWLGATPDQRARLVHHELMHCAVDDAKPVIRRHDVEEFVITARRYGADSEEQVDLVNALQQATDRTENLLGVLSETKVGGA